MIANVSCMLLQENQRHAIAFEAVKDAIAEKRGLVWIELNDPDQPTLALLQEELNLHELAIEDALSAKQRAKVEDYAGGLFIVLRTARRLGHTIKYGETHVFCGPGYLAIIRHGSGPDYRQVQERLLAYKRKPTPGLALYALIDHVVDEMRPLAAELEEHYTDLEAMLFDDGITSDILQRLYETKREIQALMSTVQPIPEICGDLIRLHPNIVEKELRAYYRDVNDHALRLIQSLDRLRDLISDAMQLSMTTAAMQQSEAVQKLAGWGAILAIPTLVFSLYGMNFKIMPELEWDWGYPLTLLVTTAACVWLHRRLKQRGWI